ncbi:MAG: response regulator [Chloroflexota bacterium]
MKNAEKILDNREESSFVIRLIDYFLPAINEDDIESVNQKRKARLIIAISLFASFLCFVIPAISLMLVIEPDISDLIALIIGVLFFGNVLWFKRVGNLAAVGVVFSILSGFVIIVLSAILGGLLASTAVFLLTWPLLNIFLIHPRAGLATATIAIIATTFFFIYYDFFFNFRIVTGDTYITVFFVCFIMAIGFITAIGLAYESFQQKSWRQMRSVLAEMEALNSELVVAKEKAEQAAQAKSEFLANMSHEIRTPLNGVIGMASLTLDTDLTDEQVDFIQTIRKSGDSLLTIINDILDFSKVEAGKIELEQHPFNLRECVEDALDLLVSKANEKNLELLYLIPQDLETLVIGDVTRLRQILINLIGNAIKFTDSGEVFVSASSELVSENVFKFHFMVRDTGIGIPKARVERLFKSFSQVDASTTRKYGGTGLGLAISKRLSELMGGTMWVESEEGTGSEFHFTAVFPIIEMPESADFDETTVNLLEDKKVLIVDDNETNRKILKSQVESWQMVPTLCESGEQALDIVAEAYHYDVILLDMQMPEMDGLMLAQRLRALSQLKRVPLFMLTSMGQLSKIDERVTLFQKVMTKPVKPSILYDELIEYFAKKKSDVQQKIAANKSGFPLDVPQFGKEYPLKILLVEDNLINQKVARKMFERFGYDPDAVANGAEALESITRQPYDLIFMDIQMPIMDGVQATRKIRDEIAPGKQPKIIAMTANALVGDREKYLKAGMDDYISKPVKIEKIQEVLLAVVSSENP